MPTKSSKNKDNKPAENTGPGAKKISALIIAAALIFLSVEFFYTYTTVKKKTRKPVFQKLWAPNEVNWVGGIHVWGDHTYILDKRNNRFVKYETLTGKYLGMLEVKGMVPVHAVESSSGSAVVSYPLQKQLVVFSEGKETSRINISEAEDISGMTIDKKDNIYICDGKKRLIYKYSLNGEKLSEFQIGGAETERPIENTGALFSDVKRGYLYLIFRGDKITLKRFDLKGNVLKEIILEIPGLNHLVQVAAASDGDLYVNDYNGERVIVLNNRGKIMGDFSSDQSNYYKIVHPGYIAAADNGYFVVMAPKVLVFKNLD